MRPECAPPWNDSGMDSTWLKKRLIAARRLRCAMRSACTTVAMLAPIDSAAIAIQTPISVAARVHSASCVMLPEPDSRPITRPNSTGSRNCSPARTMFAAPRMIARRLSPPSMASTRR